MNYINKILLFAFLTVGAFLSAQTGPPAPPGGGGGGVGPGAPASPIDAYIMYWALQQFYLLLIIQREQVKNSLSTGLKQKKELTVTRWVFLYLQHEKNCSIYKFIDVHFLQRTV